MLQAAAFLPQVVALFLQAAVCFAAGGSVIVAKSGGVASTGGDVAVVAGCRVDATDFYRQECICCR